MNPFLTLRVSLRAILRNKLRSFLTTLGIVIGVGAVIAMMAIGAGAKAQVEQAFAAMGTNILIILPGSTSSMLKPVSLAVASSSRTELTSSVSFSTMIRSLPPFGGLSANAGTKSALTDVATDTGRNRPTRNR